MGYAGRPVVLCMLDINVADTMEAINASLVYLLVRQVLQMDSAAAHPARSRWSPANDRRRSDRSWDATHVSPSRAIRTTHVDHLGGQCLPTTPRRRSGRAGRIEISFNATIYGDDQRQLTQLPWSTSFSRLPPGRMQSPTAGRPVAQRSAVILPQAGMARTPMALGCERYVMTMQPGRQFPGSRRRPPLNPWIARASDRPVQLGARS